MLTLHMSGDATWANSFFPNDFWITPGGEYLSTAGAAVNVSDPDFYTWGSTESLVSGVQSWLDSPETNFGWVLVAQNESVRDAKRFDTRENANASFRPVLQVTYALMATDAGLDAGARMRGAPMLAPLTAGLLMRVCPTLVAPMPAYLPTQARRQPEAAAARADRAQCSPQSSSASPWCCWPGDGESSGHLEHKASSSEVEPVAPSVRRAAASL